MNAARCQFFGLRPVADTTVVDVTIEEDEIDGGRCELHIDLKRRAGMSFVTMDWGDGTVEAVGGFSPAHSYTRPGVFTLRIGSEAKWFRVMACYTFDGSGKRWISRPRMMLRRWGDWIESAEGSFCGWSNSRHGGLVGRVPPWGRSTSTTRCCYEACTDIEGAFPEWTDAVADATGTFQESSLSGRVPRWGANITLARYCYSNCPGASGPVPAWPAGCTEFAVCYRNCAALTGAVPEWPECGEVLDSTFEGCAGLSGTIPKWPEAMKSVSSCYKGCAGLTDAWTHDPALLMPEEKVRYSPDSGYYRCYDVVTGCADSLRALFWDRNWGGTIPRPQ